MFHDRFGVDSVACVAIVKVAIPKGHLPTSRVSVCRIVGLAVAHMPSWQIVAVAAGRDQLSRAIANTARQLPVYNSAAAALAPMLNAAGSWYEMSNGGHLIIKSASGRLTPKAVGGQSFRLPVTLRTHPRRKDARRTGPGVRGVFPIQAWRRASRQSPSTPTFSTSGVARRLMKTTDCSSPLGAYIDNTRARESQPPFDRNARLRGSRDSQAATRSGPH